MFKEIISWFSAWMEWMAAVALVLFLVTAGLVWTSSLVWYQTTVPWQLWDIFPLAFYGSGGLIVAIFGFIFSTEIPKRPPLWF
jgi:hypothetical protein